MRHKGMVRGLADADDHADGPSDVHVKARSDDERRTRDHRMQSNRTRADSRCAKRTELYSDYGCTVCVREVSMEM